MSGSFIAHPLVAVLPGLVATQFCYWCASKEKRQHLLAPPPLAEYQPAARICAAC
jgi:hypothetical protein